MLLKDASEKTKQQLLLDMLLENENEDNITPCDKKTLSFSQRRLWILDKLLTQKSIYNVPFNLRLKGSLNEDALVLSLNKILERHPILRSFIKDNGKEEEIAISDMRVSNLEIIRYKQNDNNLLPEQFIERYIKLQINHEFNLEKGPLFKFQLLQLSNQEWILLMNFHHIIFDGWSQQLFVKELNELYRSFVEGLEISLPEPVIQYWDYSDWQQSSYERGMFEDQLQYWKKQLNGKLPILGLPIDHVYPKEPSFKGGNFAFNIQEDVANRIKSWCKAEGITLNMALLAAFKVLLYRYTNEKDILVGTPVAGRNRKEIENIIGCFINTLVIRTQIVEDQSFDDYVRHVRNTCLEAYMNQDIPFEKLVEILSPDRSLTTSPIFQVLFTFQNTISVEEELLGLDVTPLEVVNEKAKYDLSLFMADDKEGLRGEIQYNQDIFDPSTIERMAHHFLNILDKFSIDSSFKVTSVDFLTKQEKFLYKELGEGGQMAQKISDKSLSKIFEEIVELHSEKVAIKHGETQISYKEMNIQANRWAREFIRLGVNKTNSVALFMERGIDMMIAMMAIVKTGSSYIPLDIKSPGERIEIILDDCKPKLILSSSNFEKRFKLNQKSVVTIEELKRDTVSMEVANLRIDSHNEDQVYVIYTSGTTGKPKGVCAKQKGVKRLVLNIEYVNLGKDDNVAQISNAAFDAMTFEYWGALLNGATLHIAENDTILSTIDFEKWLKNSEISVMFSTVGLFNKIAKERPKSFSQVRELLIGGEICSVESINRVLINNPPKMLINVYGPTETTTFALSYKIDCSVTKSVQNFPIGKPIDNTFVYVLDENMVQTPIGVQGELFIGGYGVAKGYLNRDELTERVFLKNPFSSNPGDIIYKTGDIVKLSADGNINIVGRNDNQVKIRGFRIELGEIQDALRKIESISEAFVVFKEVEDGEKRLIAYYELDGLLNKKEIRKQLASKIPDYMIPSIFIEVDTFHLNENGKVDMHSLPSPTKSDYLFEEFTPANSLMEEILVEIWRDVLGNQIIGIDENFFEIGGHSLLAARVTTRINEVLECEVGVRLIFDNPTIRQISRYLETIFLKEESLV
ncbi:amino acid adenylation domain-containing protein [Lysinibacillus sp. RS5]|uniref:non-ribosomal peptide synthetase n=1 Tax=unclassified Lysinibacillus TaxID=2636778 RepID=UPI0035BE317E